MTISYSLTPVPRWYLPNITGQAAGSGYMYAYRSLNKTEFKPVFQDPGGQNEWTQPINWGSNGIQGPFYWEVDTDNPDETYYLEFYDSNNYLIFQIDDYTPQGGSGGNVTSILPIKNYIINNAFLRNIGSISDFSDLPVTLAPGAHADLGMPDIIFNKNNTNAVDSITFDAFILGSNPLTGDVTPEFYLDYQCTNTPSGEISKYVQFPITAKVMNLDNNQVTVTIWAKGISGVQTLDLSFYQDFGSGGTPSTNVETPISPINLSNAWAFYTFTTTVPSVSGKSLGDCGDDGLYIWVKFPTDTACEVQFTKPALYLGANFPDQEFQSHDDVASYVDTPRTGDIRTSLNSYSPFGWVPMNDGVIGNASIVAPSGVPITRANIDTFLLFEMIFDNVSDANAILYDAAGVAVMRATTNAIDAFSANYSIALTKQLGRAIASMGQVGSGTDWALGQTGGAETISITSNNLPAHTHASALSGNYISTVIGAGAAAGSSLKAELFTSTTGNNTTSHTPISVVQATTFYNVFMKL